VTGGRGNRRRSGPPGGEGELFRGGKVDPDELRHRIERAGVQAPDEEAEAAPATLPEATGSGDDDAPNRVTFTLQRDLRKRLDKYLTDRVPFMSRTQLQRLIDEGGVTVNGRAPKASTPLRLGDRVEVFVPPPPSKEILPEAIPLDVRYEDAHLIVLNKQPDIIVHPARSHLSGTMVNALAHHFRATGSGELSSVGTEFARPGVVHRLDRNTTGCIVFAKDDEAHWKLGRQFELRTVDKRYIALVHGPLEPDADVIDLPIGPHPSRLKGYREKYVVRHDELGKPSVTIYRVRGRFGAPPPQPPSPSSVDTPGPVRAGLARGGGGVSLVELELKTGRTHQIRVHLSHLGFPIVGDDMYGGRPIGLGDLPGADALRGDVAAALADRLGPFDPAEPLMARQALHAATLAFRHPITGEPMQFTAPLPADLRRLIAALRTLQPDAALLSPPGATADLGALLGE
jgi:23S rRNA pseudouridine1911/1915/1917 synthase